MRSAGPFLNGFSGAAFPSRSTGRFSRNPRREGAATLPRLTTPVQTRCWSLRGSYLQDGSSPMIEAHRRSSAMVIVAVGKMPRRGHGVVMLDADSSGRVKRFVD